MRKLLGIGFQILISTQVFASGWALTSSVRDQSANESDLPRIINAYPNHVKLINIVARSYSYYIGVQTDTYRWVGHSKCHATDPRLTIEILAVSYGALLKNSGTFAENLVSRRLPEDIDPCN